MFMLTGACYGLETAKYKVIATPYFHPSLESQRCGLVGLDFLPGREPSCQQWNPRVPLLSSVPNSVCVTMQAV